MTLQLAEHSSPEMHWRSGATVLTLAAKTNLQVRIKVQGGEWEDLCDEEVPNRKVWAVQINVHCDESDEVVP